MNRTKIPYVDYTWNPCTGCRHGCPYCFARRIAKRFTGGAITICDPQGNHRAPEGTVFPAGFQPTFYEHRLDEPCRVKQAARIFVSDMGDLFGEWVPEPWIFWVMKTIEKCPQHTFILCTKNPKRYQTWDLPANVIALTTVEDQAAADTRIPELLKCNARIKGISVEPMLGPITLPQWIRLPAMVRGDWPIGHLAVAPAGIHKVYLNPHGARSVTAENGQSLGIKPHECRDLGIGLDLVICGFMTGLGALPGHPDWVRSLRDQTKTGGANFYFKSWGEWQEGSQHDGRTKNKIILLDGTVLDSTDTATNEQKQMWPSLHPTAISRVGRQAAGRLLDGREWNEFPGVSA